MSLKISSTASKGYRTREMFIRRAFLCGKNIEKLRRASEPISILSRSPSLPFRRPDAVSLCRRRIAAVSVHLSFPFKVVSPTASQCAALFHRPCRDRWSFGNHGTFNLQLFETSSLNFRHLLHSYSEHFRFIITSSPMHSLAPLLIVFSGYRVSINARF
jgi:hypothetical protein